MDSHSEDRVSTLIKVNQFALDNTDDLTSNPNIEDERAILEADTETVFQKDRPFSEDDVTRQAFKLKP